MEHMGFNGSKPLLLSRWTSPFLGCANRAGWARQRGAAGPPSRGAQIGKLQMSANDISRYIHSIYIYIYVYIYIHIYSIYIYIKAIIYIYIHIYIYSHVFFNLQGSTIQPLTKSMDITLGRCSGCVPQSWPRCRRWWRMRRWVQKSQEALPKKIGLWQVSMEKP